MASLNSLPAEIRRLIWLEALTLDDSPGMVPFTPSASQLAAYDIFEGSGLIVDDDELLNLERQDDMYPDGISINSDDETESSTGGESVELALSTDECKSSCQVEEIRIFVDIPPLVFVNREARRITLAWAERNNVALIRNIIMPGEISHGWQQQAPTAMFARIYDPKTDYLYVDSENSHVFWDELSSARQSTVSDDIDDESRLAPLRKCQSIADVQHLAMGAQSMYLMVNTLARLAAHMPNLSSLIYVWGPTPGPTWQLRHICGTKSAVARPVWRPALLDYATPKPTGPDTMQEYDEKTHIFESAFETGWTVGRSFRKWTEPLRKAGKLRPVMEIIYKSASKRQFPKEWYSKDTGMLKLNFLACEAGKGC